MNEPKPLRRPMDIGQIIDAAIRVYRMNFGEFLAIAAVVVPINAAGAIITGLIEDAVVAAIVSIALLVPTVMVSIIAQAAIARAVADVADGAAPDFESVYRRVLSRAGTLLVTLLRVMVIVLALFITIVGIPFAIYFTIRWMFIAQAIVIEGESSSGAMELSARVVKGSWWRTFGILFIVGLLASLPIGAVTLLFSAATPIAGGLASAVAAAIALPFSAGAGTLLFFDLQARDRQRMGIGDEELPSL